MWPLSIARSGEEQLTANSARGTSSTQYVDTGDGDGDGDGDDGDNNQLPAGNQP